MNEGGGTNKGYKHTDETKKKIGRSLKGRSNRDHMIARYGEVKGEVKYQEYLNKMKHRKGKSRLQLLIENHGEIEGKILYNEFINKLKKAHTGKVLTEEHKKKIGIGRKGKKISNKGRKNMSEAKKQWWKNKK